jgi:hypothetical protein
VPAGGAAGAFVPVSGLPVSPGLQPVSSTLAARPISTIRVISLFIVGVTFTKKPQRTSKKFILFYFGVPGAQMP